MTGFIRLIDTICRALAILAGFLVLVLIVSNAYAVIMRYVLNSPLDWPLDFSEFLLVGAVFLGGAYTLQVDGHVNISLFFDAFSTRKRFFLKCCHYLAIVTFCVVLMIKGWELAWENLYARTTSISLLPLFPSYIIVPVGGFFLMLQTLAKAIKNINTHRSGESTG